MLGSRDGLEELNGLLARRGAHIEDTGTDTEDTHDVAEQAAAKRSRGSSRGESDVLDEIFGSDEDDNDSDDDDDVAEEAGDTA